MSRAPPPPQQPPRRAAEFFFVALGQRAAAAFKPASCSGTGVLGHWPLVIGHWLVRPIEPRDEFLRLVWQRSAMRLLRPQRHAGRAQTRAVGIGYVATDRHGRVQ